MRYFSDRYRPEFDPPAAASALQRLPGQLASASRPKALISEESLAPATDPHSYEPTAADGIAIARSQMAIVNGIGYDTWASKLLASMSALSWDTAVARGVANIVKTAPAGHRHYDRRVK